MPKLSVIVEGRDLIEPADRQPHRHDEPIVAEGERELGDVIRRKSVTPASAPAKLTLPSSNSQ